MVCLEQTSLPIHVVEGSILHFTPACWEQHSSFNKHEVLKTYHQCFICPPQADSYEYAVSIVCHTGNLRHKQVFGIEMKTMFSKTDLNGKIKK